MNGNFEKSYKKFITLTDNSKPIKSKNSADIFKFYPVYNLKNIKETKQAYPSNSNISSQSINKFKLNTTSSKALNLLSENKSTKRLYSDILTTYASTKISSKKDNHFSFKDISYNNKSELNFFDSNKKIFNDTFSTEDIFQFKLPTEDIEEENYDKLNENHHTIQKLKITIKSVLLGNEYSKEKVLLKDNLINRKENQINFKEDIMQMPYIKNKLHSNSYKSKIESKVEEVNNFTMPMQEINKSRRITEEILIHPNFIDSKSNNYLTELKKTIQKKKDIKEGFYKGNQQHNSKQEKYDNHDVWLNKDLKDYFCSHILKYRNISIVDQRTRQTILNYNDKLNNFHDLKSY